MNIVKYKVTSEFGVRDIGEIIEAIMLIEDEDSGMVLLYHPRSSNGDCASLEYARYDTKENFYVSVDIVNPYINIVSGKSLNKLKAQLDEINYKNVYVDKNNKIKSTRNLSVKYWHGLTLD